MFTITTDLFLSTKKSLESVSSPFATTWIFVPNTLLIRQAYPIHPFSLLPRSLHNLQFPTLTTSLESMKVLFSFLTVLPLVSGWSSPASPVTRPVSSALHMASTTVRPPNWDDYPVQHDRRVETKGVVERKVSWMERQAMKDAVIDPDYTLTIGLAALAPLIFWYHPRK